MNQNIPFDTLIQKAIQYDTLTLITGETGTGKSHIARLIHQQSPRAPRPWGVVNIACLSSTLLESELFGHERGAFSGATHKRKGKLESGNFGTVFLDEIGELPLNLQAKLLDFIQNKTIVPVGANEEILLNVRIIAATNRNLREEVSRGKFREDLYYRLKLLEIHIPPLKERLDQIKPLCDRFIEEINGQLGTKIHGLVDAAWTKLYHHSWPGNIRELRNTLELACLLRGCGQLQFDDVFLDEGPKNQDTTAMEKIEFSNNYHHAKEEFEKAYFEQMMERFRGRINETARKTQISKSTLIEKLRRYEIDAGIYR